MSPTVPSRRAFLAGMLLLVPGWRSPASAADVALAGAAPCRVDRRLLTTFIGDWRAACGLGGSYLREHRGEADLGWLIRSTFGDSRSSSRALRRRVAAIRRRDLRDGDVVIVDGWQLARTEARLCAIASLLAA